MLFQLDNMLKCNYDTKISFKSKQRNRKQIKTITTVCLHCLMICITITLYSMASILAK